MTTPTISASDVKELRQRTGAGMMDCKSALQESGGDMDRAVELLRVKMGNKIGKLADRTATEGTVQSYIHANGKIGVLVEVDCNTDFVAKNDDFIDFAKEVAMHIAASPTTQFVSEDEVTDEAKEAEVRVFEQQAADKPDNIRPKIVEGRVKKWLEEVVLLNQKHVNEDKHESRTIDQMRGDLSAKTGENVVIRRFTRFAVGECPTAPPPYSGASCSSCRASHSWATSSTARTRRGSRPWPRRSSACTIAASRSRSCSARATSTEGSRARPRAWTARPRTTWACSRSC